MIESASLWEESTFPMLYLKTNMNPRENWTEEDWNEYYAFLAYEEYLEDLYFAEYFGEMQADAREEEF